MQSIDYYRVLLYHFRHWYVVDTQESEKEFSTCASVAVELSAALTGDSLQRPACSSSRSRPKSPDMPPSCSPSSAAVSVRISFPSHGRLPPAEQEEVEKGREEGFRSCLGVQSADIAHKSTSSSAVS